MFRSKKNSRESSAEKVAAAGAAPPAATASGADGGRPPRVQRNSSAGNNINNIKNSNSSGGNGNSNSNRNSMVVAKSVNNDENLGYNIDHYHDDGASSIGGGSTCLDDSCASPDRSATNLDFTKLTAEERAAMAELVRTGQLSTTEAMEQLKENLESKNKAAWRQEFYAGAEAHSKNVQMASELETMGGWTEIMI